MTSASQRHGRQPDGTCSQLTSRPRPWSLPAAAVPKFPSAPEGSPHPIPGSLPQEASGQEEGTTGAHASSPGEERTVSRSGLSLRSIMGDLVIAAVAAAGTAACAVAGLMHLPLLAIALVTFSVAAIAATMSQAIAARKVPATAQTWWCISRALLILLGAGALTYHEEFDPATTGQGLPFSAVVRVDSSVVIDQGCRKIVLPGRWHNTGTPPEPLTNAGVNQWQFAHHGIDGDETAIVVELQGISDQAVTIDPPQVVVDSRKEPVHGVVAQLSGGCGGELAHRVFAVNLDQQEPVATLEPGSPYPPSQVEGRPQLASGIAELHGLCRRSRIFRHHRDHKESLLQMVYQLELAKHGEIWHAEAPEHGKAI